MTLKFKFLAYIIFLHIIILVLSFGYFKENTYYFFIVEILVLFSIYIAYKIYSHYIKPFNLTSLTIKSINDNEFDLNYLESNNEEINQLIIVFNKMLNQLRKERRAQKEQHYFLEKLIEAMPIGIIILDGDERIKNLNSSSEKILKLNKNAIIGQYIENQKTPIFSFIKTLKEGTPKIFINNGVERYRITKSHFIDKGFHNHFVLIEEQSSEVLQTEKEAYGKIIRMMSHEVNNSVGAINSLVSSLHYYSDSLNPEHKQDYTNALEVISERNINMNQFMNNFANILRIPTPNKSLIELNSFIKQIALLMQPFCNKRDTVIETKFSDEKYFINIDKNQIEQLLVNVIKNAAEAINDNGKIIIIVDAENNELKVIDNGIGIKKDQEQKLYTPFYSSKETGQGIGLTLCREIALNHGFAFDLENHKPKGAIFTLYFSTLSS